MESTCTISGHLQKCAEWYCKETGHVCPHWVDSALMDELIELDKEHGLECSTAYWNLCHSLEFIYRPNAMGHDARCEIRCRPNDFSSGERCGYTNPEAAERMLKEEFSFVEEWPNA